MVDWYDYKYVQMLQAQVVIQGLAFQRFFVALPPHSDPHPHPRQHEQRSLRIFRHRVSFQVLTIASSPPVACVKRPKSTLAHNTEPFLEVLLQRAQITDVVNDQVDIA